MISIIIPTYNNLELFKRAYHSVESQTEKDIEIIVVDDSSTNDIQTYCQKLPVLYHHNRPALGAVKNWNSGLKKAKGDFVILMHHDEAMKDKNFLGSVQTSFRQGYDVVVSNIEIHKGDIIRKGLCSSWLKRIFVSHSSLLLVRNLIGPCACVAFKKEKIVFFDEKLKWTVDMEWYYRLLKKANVHFLQDNWISSIHGHKDQITCNLDVSRQARQDSNYLREKYRWNLIVRICLLSSSIIHQLEKTIKRVK